MNKYIFPVYRVLVPKPIRSLLLKKSLRRKIRNHLASLPENEIDDEQRELLDYLEKNPVSLFPYPFDSNYPPSMVDVFSDKAKGMKYVLQNGKRLYFKKGYSNAKVRTAFAALAREQDPACPHCYLSDDFSLGSNDVIVDVGASEGNFSLSQVDKVKKIYLIDYDREWIRAMEATFSPWKEKIEIIPKYVANCDDDKNVTLDTLLSEHPDITFLKIDVEGFERKVLEGASGFFATTRPLKIAVCTYHKHDDERELSEMLLHSGFKIKPSHGYMIPLFDKRNRSPWIRRALLRATR
jgi:hypothetical protein